MTRPNLADFDSRALRDAIAGAMFGYFGSVLLALIDEGEPHVLSARNLRRALDAAPPDDWRAYAAAVAWLNPDLNGPHADETRDALRRMAEQDLRRWRRLRPVAPDEIAAHRLDLEGIR